MTIFIFSLLQTMVGLLCSCAQEDHLLGKHTVMSSCIPWPCLAPSPLELSPENSWRNFSLRMYVAWGFEGDNPLPSIAKIPV